MALYTVILSFREQQRTFQVTAGSATGAIKAWAEGLDTHKTPNFGDLSRDRLIKQLEWMGVNESDELPGVWTWVASISGYTTSIVIVATDERVA